MTNYLVNYSYKSHKEAQKNNFISTLNIGGFDKVFSYNLNDLGEDFLNENNFSLYLIK